MDSVMRDPDKWDHFGIRGILERARLVGGEGKIESKKAHGTTIVVDIPLDKKETKTHGED
jgi:two-component system sensor histidine kinase DegS